MLLLAGPSRRAGDTGLEVHQRVSESLSLLHTISTQHRVVKIEEGVTNPSWKSPGRRQ